VGRSSSTPKGPTRSLDDAVAIRSRRAHRHDHPKGYATFHRHCNAGCSLRSRCTTAKAGVHIRIRDHNQELVEARRAWRDHDFIDDYRRWRPMVERAIAWLVAHGHRRVAYRGVQRNQLGLSLRVAALNLRRLVNLGLTPTPTGWALT
jgi:hypothetical protein